MRLGNILSHAQFVPQLTSLRFLADSSKMYRNKLSQSRAKPLDMLICNGLFYVPINTNFGKKLLRERGMHGLNRAFHTKKKFGRTEDKQWLQNKA